LPPGDGAPRGVDTGATGTGARHGYLLAEHGAGRGAQRPGALGVELGQVAVGVDGVVPLRTGGVDLPAQLAQLPGRGLRLGGKR
jgi:hypothetical protein